MLDVPDGEGEHAIEMAHAVRAILLVRAHEYFGIGSRAKAVAQGLQPGAERLEVVDLTVKGAPDRAILIRDRLITGLKIDDAEPPDAQRDEWVNIETLTVGAAVA